MTFSVLSQFRQDSIRLSKLKPDSALFRKMQQIDSAQSHVRHKLDSITGLSQKINHITDTLKPDLSKYKSRLDSISGKLTHLTDSLKPDLQKYSRKLDSIKGKLTHRIDSLTKLNLPTAQYAHVLDSIHKAGPIKDVKLAEAKLAALERKVNQPFNQINSGIKKTESAINEKLALINKEAGGKANLPGNTNLPTGQTGLPTGQTGLLNLQVPSLNPGPLPNANLNLQSGSLPGIDDPLNKTNGPGNTNLQVPGVNPGALPNTNLNLPAGSIPGELKDVGKVGGEINSLTSAPQKEFNQLKNEVKLGQVENELSQVKGYSKDLKNLSKGNIDSVKQLNGALEKRVMQMGDMKQFQAETNKLDQYRKLANKENDPEAMKKLALQEAKKQAVNHFAGKEKQVQAAMAQMSGLKKKYSSLASLKDIPKRIPNDMHGKPLIERILPGLTWQLQKKKEVLVDINPLVGYRLTGRFTVGGGWNERVGIRHSRITHFDRIYGPRTFVDFKISKGFSVRSEVEKMNTFVPALGLTGPNDGSRQWVWGVFVGVKKEYKLTKYIRGNVQTMYNFLDRRYNMSPYADRINVRMGFEFPMKKKVHSDHHGK
ncbi:MAG TPA: hypothetical protein VK517_04215 [Cyclobacteriaceae bacterium]|nr:hypothetical protein [Cyclobacteriaceae bacterium]